MLFPRGSHVSDYGNMEGNTRNEWGHFVQYFPAPNDETKHNLSSGVFFLMMFPRTVPAEICALKMSNHAGLVDDSVRPDKGDAPHGPPGWWRGEGGGFGMVIGVNCTYLLLRRFVKLFISFAGFYQSVGDQAATITRKLT